MRSEKQTKAFRSTCITATISGSLAIAIYIILTPEFLANGYQIREFTLSERLITQLIVVTQYLSVFFVPDVSIMSLYQDSFPISHELALSEGLATIFLATLALTAWFIRTHHPIFSFGILFYLASQVMESTILPLELAFEHRNYIGTVGLSMSLIYVTGHLLQRITTPKIRYALFSALVLLLSVQTTTRALEWQDEMSLATSSVVKKPDSLRALISLTTGLIHAQKPAETIKLLDDFTARKPTIALPQLMAFYMQTTHGVNDLQRVQRIEQQLKNSYVSRDTVKGLGNLSDLFERLPERHPARSQIIRFHDDVSTNMSVRLMPNELAAFHAKHSRLLTLENQNERAIASLHRATALNPKNREIRLRLAEALATVSKWEKVKKQVAILDKNMAGVDFNKVDSDFWSRRNALKRRLENILSIDAAVKNLSQ